ASSVGTYQVSVTVEGIQEGFLVLPTRFEVVAPAIFDKYLIQKDVGEFKFITATGYWHKDSAYYLALYTKNDERFMAGVNQFGSRTELDDKVNRVLNDPEWKTGKETINNQEIYVSVSTKEKVYWWTSANKIILISVPTFSVTESTAGASTVSIDTPLIEERVIVTVSSEIVQRRATIPPSLEISPLLTAYLEKHPSDVGKEVSAEEQLRNALQSLGIVKTGLTGSKIAAERLVAYYESSGDTANANKWREIANMYQQAIDKITAIENKINRNLNNPESILDEVKRNIQELRELLAEISLKISETATVLTIEVVPV
ncbi:MAG: hypothetical protein HYS80_02655, partial [Candidatus Aenigmarchaeota archaeon]|nr:hypothetical protein [Candidatus Aenigmarchaeota archaeon]